MIIIVEGPDGCGKSTLVRELNDNISGSQVIHFGPPDPIDLDPFLQYEKILYPYIEQGNTIICDRSHWSERVYGPLLRGHDRLGNAAAWRHVELFLAAHDAFVVVPDVSIKELQQRLTKRGDDLITPAQVPEIWDAYQSVIWEETRLDIINLPLDRLLNQVFRFIERRRTPHIHGPSTYVGDPVLLDLLLCGEQRNDLPEPEFWSSFVPRPKSSGFYLLECMPDPLWRYTGLVNACEEDVFHRWHALGEPPVIALGRNASRALVQQAVPHSIVPHPQYVRRFFHKKINHYGDLIEAVSQVTAPGVVYDAGGWRGEDAFDFVNDLEPLKFQTIKH